MEAFITASIIGRYGKVVGIPQLKIAYDIRGYFPYVDRRSIDSRGRTHIHLISSQICLSIRTPRECGRRRTVGLGGGGLVGGGLVGGGLGGGGLVGADWSGADWSA